MSASLGRTRIDGSFDLADISVLNISTGRIIENTVGNSITTYKVEDNQEAGGILLASGNYANPLTPAVGSPGEANTASNQGSGAGLVMPKSGADLPFKSINVIGGTITEDADSITITITIPEPEPQKVFKTQSTHTESLDSTLDLVITPPSGGRVVIESMMCSSSNATNNTFSIKVGGVDFISSGSKVLVPYNGFTTTSDRFKVGNGEFGGGVSKLVFGIDDIITINKGSSSNFFVSYNIEVLDA